MNPARLVATSVAVTEEVDRCVGSTSLIVQGWRPYSATIQPSSIAIHGRGMLQRASFRIHWLFARRRRATMMNADANTNRNQRPRPTMRRNDQKIGKTLGIVSSTAARIWSGVASTTAGAYFLSSNP